MTPACAQTGRLTTVTKTGMKKESVDSSLNPFARFATFVVEKSVEQAGTTGSVAAGDPRCRGIDGDAIVQ